MVISRVNHFTTCQFFRLFHITVGFVSPAHKSVGVFARIVKYIFGDKYRHV